jgi:purine-nucleoside phosphorylase
VTETLWDRAGYAAEAIRKRDERTPRAALVLGSGLGAYADTLKRQNRIPYAEIPGFAISTVAGHAGTLVIGEVEGMPVAVMQGRVHLYEGLGAAAVTFPVRALHRLGATHLLITNSAGAVREQYAPGDLVLLRDHLNLTGTNPLLGDNDERFGPRFPDMTDAYDPELRELALDVAAEQRIALKTGVYAGLLGPTYETPAEVRMVRALGGDLVGMSTVLEVIVARHMGMRVLGCSCASNLAAGLSEGPLTHEEVTETAERVRVTFEKLIDGVLRRLAAALA